MIIIEEIDNLRQMIAETVIDFSGNLYGKNCHTPLKIVHFETQGKRFLPPPSAGTL